jgi:hypothetical protein
VVVETKAGAQKEVGVSRTVVDTLDPVWTDADGTHFTVLLPVDLDDARVTLELWHDDQEDHAFLGQVRRVTQDGAGGVQKRQSRT